jgi:hypothetical protein
LAAAVVSTYVGLKIAPLEKENASLVKRLDEVHGDAKDAKEKLETRLQAIEKTYIDRAELNRSVEAFGSRSDRNTARIEAVIISLGQKVDNLAERVGRVEAA